MSTKLLAFSLSIVAMILLSGCSSDSSGGTSPIHTIPTNNDQTGTNPIGDDQTGTNPTSREPIVAYSCENTMQGITLKAGASGELKIDCYDGSFGNIAFNNVNEIRIAQMISVTTGSGIDQGSNYTMTVTSNLQEGTVHTQASFAHANFDCVDTYDIGQSLPVTISDATEIYDYIFFENMQLVSTTCPQDDGTDDGNFGEYGSGSSLINVTITSEDGVVSKYSMFTSVQ